MGGEGRPGLRVEELDVRRKGPDSWGPEIALAAKSLRERALLIHPTSTVYGIGAAADPVSDLEICRLKGHRGPRPLIRLAATPAAVRTHGSTVRWDDRCDRLARAFWPGSLTLLLDDGTPEGLAVRVDAHPAVRAVLERFGGLLSSTSLNQAGRPPASSAVDVRRTLRGMPGSEYPAKFLNAGTLPESEPSTILDLRAHPARVVRVGAVALDRLEEQLGERLEPVVSEIS